MATHLQALSEFRKDYADALSWLRQLKVRTLNTRLSRYLSIMDDAIAREAKGATEHQESPDFASMLVEASEIIQIAALDSLMLTDHDPLTKLRQIPRGPDVIRETGEDPGRDYAFEFCTASEANRNGVSVRFGTDGGDVLLTNEQYPIECKRISSLRRIEQRVREGRDQLIDHVGKGGRPGLVALDLSRPIRLAQGPIRASDDNAMMLQAEQQLNAYLHHHVHQNGLVYEAAVDRSVLGILFRFVAFGTVGKASNVRRSTVWGLQLIHPDDSEKSILADRLATLIRPGPTNNVSDAEMYESVQRFDARRSTGSGVPTE